MFNCKEPGCSKCIFKYGKDNLICEKYQNNYKLTDKDIIQIFKVIIMILDIVLNYSIKINKRRLADKLEIKLMVFPILLIYKLGIKFISNISKNEFVNK